MPSFFTVIVAFGACLPMAVISQASPPATTTPSTTGTQPPAATTPLVPGTVVPGAHTCTNTYINGPDNATIPFPMNGAQVNQSYSICVPDFDAKNTLRCAKSSCQGLTSCNSCHKATIDPVSSNVTVANDPESKQTCNLAFINLGTDPNDKPGKVTDPNAVGLCMPNDKEYFQCKMSACEGIPTCQTCMVAPPEDSLGSDANEPPAGGNGQGSSATNSAPTNPSGQATS